MIKGAKIMKLFAGAPSFQALLGQILEIPEKKLSLPEDLRAVVKKIDTYAQQGDLDQVNNLIWQLKTQLPQVITDITPDKAKQTKLLQTISNIHSFVIDAKKNIEPFKRLHKDVFKPAGITTEGITDAITSYEQLMGSFNAQMLGSISSAEDTNKLLQFNDLFLFFNTLYGRTGADIDRIPEELKSRLLTFGSRFLDKSSEQYTKYTGAVEKWVGQHQDTLKSIAQFYRHNPDLAMQDIFSQQGLETFIKKQEKFNRNVKGYAPIADVFTATIGLKGKSVTGIVVDTLLDPNKSLSDLTNFVIRSISLGSSFKTFLTTSMSTDEFVNRLRQLSIAPENILSSYAFKQALEKAKNVQFDIEGFNYYKVMQQFEEAATSITPAGAPISPQLAHQLRNTASLLVGSAKMHDQQILANNMTDSIDLLSTLRTFVADTQEQLTQMLTKQEQYAVTSVSRKSIDQLQQQLANIFGISVKDKSPAGTGPSFQSELSAMFKDADLNNPLSVAEQLRRYEQEQAINIQLVLQADAQKTVDKSNTKVIIQSLVNSLAQNTPFDQEPTNILTSIYNALYSGDLSQFKTGEILNLLKRKQDQLDRFGFTEEFITGVKSTTSADQFFKDLRSKYVSNIENVTKFLYESMREDIQPIVTNQSIQRSIKELIAYDTLTKYINVGQTLSLGSSGEQLMRRQYIASGITELFQTGFERALGGQQAISQNLDVLFQRYMNFAQQVSDLQEDDIAYQRWASLQKRQFIDVLQEQLGIEPSSIDYRSMKLVQNIVADVQQELKNIKKAKPSKASTQKPKLILPTESEQQLQQQVEKPKLILPGQDKPMQTPEYITLKLRAKYKYVDENTLKAIVQEAMENKTFAKTISKEKTFASFQDILQKSSLRYIDRQQLRFGQLADMIQYKAQQDTSYGMAANLTIDTYKDVVDDFIKGNYASDYQLQYLVKRKMKSMSEATMFPYIQISSLTDLATYRFIREPRKQAITRMQRTTRYFEEQLKGGAYQKIRSLIQGGILTPDMNLSQVVPPVMQKQFQYVETQGLPAEGVLKYKQTSLNVAEGRIEAQDLGLEEDELFEEMSEDAMRQGEGIKVYQTGIIYSFDESKSGGLIVTPGSGETFSYTETQARYAFETVFDQPEAAMQAIKTWLGVLAPQYAEMMYKPSNLGLPVMMYTTAKTGIKYEARRDLINMLFNRMYSYTQTGRTFQSIDLLRAMFLSHRNAQEIDPELYFVLHDVMNQDVLTNFLNAKKLNLKEQTEDVFKEFFAQRLGKLSNSQFQRLKSIIGSTPTESNVYEWIYNRMLKRTKELYYSHLQYKSTFELEQLPEYLLGIQQFNYKGVLLSIVPHRLTDAISISSPNTVGSTVALKPYGHAVTPIQEMFNPVAAQTDAVRVINTYGAKAPDLVIDHTYRRTSELVDYVYQLNEKRAAQLLKVKMPGVYEETLETTEMPGFLMPTGVVDKENISFFSSVLGTDLTMVGDAYFMQKQLAESLKIQTRDKFGKVTFADIPEQLKITGIARSKGMVTFRFDREIAVEINGQLIPVGAFINTQGKRKNKIAEFLQGSLRAYKYIYGEDMFNKLLPEIAEGIDVTKPVAWNEFTKNVTEKMSDVFLNKMKGTVYIKEGDKWARTNITMPLIFHKVYAYTGKSHQAYWTEISNQSAQVLPQLALFKQTGLLSLLLSSDASDNDIEKAIMLTNTTTSLSEGAQAGQIQALIEKGYVKPNYAARKQINKGAGIHSQRNIGLLQGLQPFVNVFSSIKSQEVVRDNVVRLRQMAQQFRSARIQDARLQRTQDLLDVLSDILTNPRTQLDTGNIVFSITESQAKRLQQFAGEEILIPAVATQYFETLTGQAGQIGLNKWSTYRMTKVLTQIAKEQGNIITLSAGDAGIQMAKMYVPRLFNNTGAQLHLSLEAETFMNMFQGIHSLLQNVARGDAQRAMQSFKFYSSRMMTLGNIQTRAFARTLSKRHGIGISGLHATAREDLGGTRMPKRQLQQLIASQVKSNVITLDELKSHLPASEISEIEQYVSGQKEMKVNNLFERWSRSALIIDWNNKLKDYVIYYNPEQGKYANEREIYELVQQNVPILEDLSILKIQKYKNARAFQKRQIMQLIDKYQGFLQYSERAGGLAIEELNRGLRVLEPPYKAFDFATKYGEMWGYIQRHPIIGHLPHIRIVGFSRHNTIDVPKHVAEQIAGDDDGDMINLLPYILIGPEVFQQRRAIITKYGTYGYTMAEIMSVRGNRHDELFDELQMLKERATKWL